MWSVLLRGFITGILSPVSARYPVHGLAMSLALISHLFVEVVYVV